MKPSGRRPGDSGTRDAILAEAREAFSAQGYTATSLRAVARTAGVDPSLVTHFFGSKSGLFDAAVELPMDPATLVGALLSEGVAGLGERIVRAFLVVWDGAPGQGPMLAMLRGAVSHEDSADRLRTLLLRVILRPLVEGIGADQPERRAALVASQVVGLAMTRYVLRFEPITSAAADELAPILGATLQHYLTDQLRPVSTSGPQPRTALGEVAHG
ncbi:TetR family transcriptional regulator [Rhodococcus antarcticus]|uniref:TetR family transcriptional regulator n=1 Tax=Rhodococcus antarcticus TaxID=2987751 RepID=A0ABY6P4D9_9NOCA|nr:TetR family transcriptional regulator [Rhodococcus antarcticus]UZJ26038.1 TetR family transcriptional regulator [Rhodococcus antarcticus]